MLPSFENIINIDTPLHPWWGNIDIGDTENTVIVYISYSFVCMGYAVEIIWVSWEYYCSLHVYAYLCDLSLIRWADSHRLWQRNIISNYTCNNIRLVASIHSPQCDALVNEYMLIWVGLRPAVSGSGFVVSSFLLCNLLDNTSSAQTSNCAIPNNATIQRAQDAGPGTFQGRRRGPRFRH